MPTTLEEEIPAHSPDEDSDTAHMSSTFVPLPATGITERQAIQQSVSQHVNWPSTTGHPINEFTTDGYMSCAFPTLFPTGAADYLAPRQRLEITSNT